ncbi:hypothetical protein AC579_4840 [Pseudocercospora musae]|uniref:Uncharacterized protein n=1 Tax=Pseudocercospora musae TaxID=113226 RepID=A0A139IKH3_9PEZI|nr:hypothetical protein AC579_4840 [Pseudocercospora musae]
MNHSFIKQQALCKAGLKCKAASAEAEAEAEEGHDGERSKDGDEESKKDEKSSKIENEQSKEDGTQSAGRNYDVEESEETLCKEDNNYTVRAAVQLSSQAQLLRKELKAMAKLCGDLDDLDEDELVDLAGDVKLQWNKILVRSIRFRRVDEVDQGYFQAKLRRQGCESDLGNSVRSAGHASPSSLENLLFMSHLQPRLPQFPAVARTVLEATHHEHLQALQELSALPAAECFAYASISWSLVFDLHSLLLLC